MSWNGGVRWWRGGSDESDGDGTEGRREVQMGAKKAGKRGKRGGTTAFLKMRVGSALVALRAGGCGEGRFQRGSERNDCRWRLGSTMRSEKKTPRGEADEKKKGKEKRRSEESTNRIDSLSRVAVTSLSCRPIPDREEQLASHPLLLFRPLRFHPSRYLFISRRIRGLSGPTWRRKGRYVPL